MRTLLRFLLVLAWVLVFVAWVPFLFISTVVKFIDLLFETLLKALESGEERLV